MIDELAVPDRLEDAVRKPQRQHVLNGLLAEVVVDSEDLVLAEPAVQQLVQLQCRAEIAAERLLDDQPHPSLLVSPLSDLRHSRRERLRRHGEVVEAVAGSAMLGVDLLQCVTDGVLPIRVVEVGADVSHPARKRRPDVLSERVACVLLDGLLHRGRELGRCLLRPRDTDDGESLGQELAVRESVERREELALRQVAGGTEDHDRARLGPAPDVEALEKRVRLVAHADASEPTLARIPSRSSANESANFSTPSASSVATTSS